MKRYGFLATCAVLSTASIAGFSAAKAYAGTGQNDALAFQRPKISLLQAVAAAEKYTSGRAVRAELERHAGQPVYDVEVVNGRKVMDVRVDKESGRVLAATVDKSDHDDGQDAED